MGGQDAVLLLSECRTKSWSSAVMRMVGPLTRLAPVTLLLVATEGDEVAFWVDQPGELETILQVTFPTPANAETLAPWLAEWIGQQGFSHVAAASSTWSRDLLPRLAAMLDLSMVSGVSGIVDRQTFQRPVLAGRGLETVRINQQPVIMTLQASLFPANSQFKETPLPVIAIPPPEQTMGSRHVAFLPSPSTHKELTTASVVVAGGQGVGDLATFGQLEQLAALLGGAVGASRAAVDAGFAPNDWQIGQTGKTIAPQLYLAAGISGAIQHLAGIQAAETMVVINKDEAAPIFAISDYGLVGDLHKVLPELLTLLQQD
ncbi:MAG: electron transfer flavoprotein subunit alpha/FixB family protein [Magnetococcales bacterium]|nr:electron transfer flavoprotein subunit alpha/FixB family protein [Magnetococcales bacterium]NGZ28222.1 electron transfer flavoprotein subunit alpha/FixB family protein [Magnetococcales bacterium]